MYAAGIAPAGFDIDIVEIGRFERRWTQAKQREQPTITTGSTNEHIVVYKKMKALVFLEIVTFLNVFHFLVITSR